MFLRKLVGAKVAGVRIVDEMNDTICLELTLHLDAGTLEPHESKVEILWVEIDTDNIQDLADYVR